VARIFLSHSTKDREFVERELVQLLHGHGLKFWYSKLNILTAEQWQEAILRGLEECEWFVVVMSPRAVASRWVRAEVTWAFEHRAEGMIIPLLLEECNYWKLHMQIPLLQHVDFRQATAEARQKLVELVRSTPVHGIPRRVIPGTDFAPERPAAATKSPIAPAPAPAAKPAPPPKPCKRVQGRRIAPSRRKLGQILVDLGFMDEDQLWNALQEARQSTQRLGEVAVGMGYINEGQLYQSLAEQNGLEFHDLDEVEFDPAAAGVVPNMFAEFHGIVPVAWDSQSRVLTIATSAPENVTAWDEVRNLLGVSDVLGIVATRQQILDALHRLYH
jgi:hypothetical protein